MERVNILVTGASRGLGLGLVRYFLEKTQHIRVIATARTPATATDLQALKQTYGDRLVIGALDVANEAAFPVFKASLLELGIDSFDLIIANAGISQPATGIKDGVGHALDATPNGFKEIFQTNVVGASLTFTTFFDFVERRRGKTLIGISSGLGSINASGTWNVASMYSSSKAAFNMWLHRLGGDPRVAANGIKVISLHPGWVRTDMGGSNADISVDESVAGMLDIVNKALSIQLKTAAKHGETPFEKAFEEKSVVFTAYDGTILPW